MKKFCLAILLVVGLVGISVDVEDSQATLVGGPCDTALDTYGGQSAVWNWMCIQYAIATNECIDAGDCDHYVP